MMSMLKGAEDIAKCKDFEAEEKQIWNVKKVV